MVKIKVPAVYPLIKDKFSAFAKNSKNKRLMLKFFIFTIFLFDL